MNNNKDYYSDCIIDREEVKGWCERKIESFTTGTTGRKRERKAERCPVMAYS